MEQKRMPIFAERFAQLRGEMTQGEFAEFLGISRPTVGFYENGTRLPDALILRQIVEKCNVSADWLLGITDVLSQEIDVQVACELIGLSEHAVCKLFELDDYIGIVSDLITAKQFEDFLNALAAIQKQAADVQMEKGKIAGIIKKEKWMGYCTPKFDFAVQESELSKQIGFKVKIVSPSERFECTLKSVEKHARSIAEEMSDCTSCETWAELGFIDTQLKEE